MARGVNKVIIVGNCGQDPETKFMPSGSAVANLTVATSETWKDKQTGDKQERTEWHRVAFYGKLAEIVGEYLKKGSKVYVEGSLRTRKWQDQGGQDRYTTEIIANELQMLDSREGGQAPKNQGYQQPQQQAPQYQGGYQHPKQQAVPQGHGGYQSQPPQAPAGFEFDDDIPFN